MGDMPDCLSMYVRTDLVLFCISRGAFVVVSRSLCALSIFLISFMPPEFDNNDVLVSETVVMTS